MTLSCVELCAGYANGCDSGERHLGYGVDSELMLHLKAMAELE